MKTIILNQRKERDELLSRPYLERRSNQDTEMLLSSRLIKLITGPRRVGKSTQALLMLRNRNFAYLNFDSQQLLDAWDADLVMRMLDDVYPGYEYLLLDEVQNLDAWDLWVSELYRLGKNLVITGSNAKMLSSEMATALTGKYLKVEMLPFSLEEFFDWNKLDLKKLNPEQQADASALMDDYLRNGGYPEVVASRQLTRTYLDTLFDSIVWKDVAKRHSVRNVTDLNDLALYLVSNFCNPVSANELTEELGFSSVNTTKKFMDYLHEPYLFYYLPRYNNKLKLMKKAPRKAYVVDNGFVAAKAFSLSDNLGRLLENQVFVELLRQGYLLLCASHSEAFCPNYQKITCGRRACAPNWGITGILPSHRRRRRQAACLGLTFTDLLIYCTNGFSLQVISKRVLTFNTRVSSKT